MGTARQKAVTSLCRNIAGPVPYVLKIDLLQNCNLKCKICYATHGSIEMSLDDFKTIVRPLKNAGCRIDLMGGEPFLYSRLNEAISYARHDMKFKEAFIYTNGTCVTSEKAVSAKKAGLTHAMINISSHDEKQHDLFTGVKGSWKASITGLKHLKKAGVITHPFIVLHNDNINDYALINKFFREELECDPVFYQYIPKDLKDPLLPSKEKWNAVKKQILCEDETGRKHARTVEKLITLCGKNCLGGYFSFSVKVNGDVTPCPFINDIIIGNALEENFWIVFMKRNENPIFRDFSSVPLDCKACTYRLACSGGCRAGQNGKYLLKDPRCLGPWSNNFSHEKLFEKIPSFF